MNSRGGGPQIESRDRAAERLGRIGAADRPWFWLIAAAVFLLNSLFSGVNGSWWLGALQALTGLLAITSAAALAGRRPRAPRE
jgi:hypothetical protein